MRARNDLSPVLIFPTRYGGTYEGGEWAAMTGKRKVPSGAVADDVACGAWWSKKRRQKIGLGDTPMTAYQDLCAKHPEEGMIVEIFTETDELFTTVALDADEWRLMQRAATVLHLAEPEEFLLHAIRLAIKLDTTIGEIE